MRRPAPPIRLSKRTLAVAVAGFLALLLARPALAEYLGPDRVTTEFREVRDPHNDVWTLTHVDPSDGYSDVCLIIHTCEEHPGVAFYSRDEICGEGWVADNSGCDRAYRIKEFTIVHPEATIGSDLQDCEPVDGWCTEEPTLHLEGTEPVSGQTITLIEGTRNGEPFACPGAVCEVPLLQGGNDFSFWALSSWGDSSQMGTLAVQVDSKGPKVHIPDSWYIWEPLAIQVDEDGNGLERVSLTIDGGEYGDRSYSWAGSVVPEDFIWDRRFGDIIAPIGDYPVTVRAKDSLGNIATASGEIVIPDPGSADEGADGPASPLSTGEGLDSAEDLAWLIDPYPLPSSGVAGAGDESGLDAAGTEDANLPAGALSSTANAGASARVGAVPSGVTTEGGGTGLLWGAAALTAAASATAYGLSRRKARLDYIREMRERAAEMSSPKARQARLTSLWNAAQARVAPIRAAMASAAASSRATAASAVAATAAAAASALAATAAGAASALAATAAAAAEARRRIDEAMRQRARQRRGEREQLLEQAEFRAAEEVRRAATAPEPRPQVSTIPPQSVVDLIPSFSFTPHETKHPLLALGILEAGAYELWRVGIDLNPVVKLTSQNFTVDLGRVSIAGGLEGRSFGINIETPSMIRSLDDGGTEFITRQSASLRVNWDGWNTSLSARYYAQDFTVRTQATLGASGGGVQGIYIEERPIQGLVALGFVVVTTVAVATMGPAALDAIGRFAEQFKVPVLAPGT